MHSRCLAEDPCTGGIFVTGSNVFDHNIMSRDQTLTNYHLVNVLPRSVDLKMKFMRLAPLHSKMEVLTPRKDTDTRFGRTGLDPQNLSWELIYCRAAVSKLRVGV